MISMGRMMHTIVAAIASLSAGVNAETVTSLLIARSAYAQYGSDDLIAHLDAIENAGAGTHESSPSTWVDLTGNLSLTKTGSAAFSGDAWVADGSSFFTTTSDAAKTAINGGAFTLEMVISHPSTQNMYEYWAFFGGGSSTRLLSLDLRTLDSENPLLQGLQYRATAWNKDAAIAEFSGSKTKWDTRQYIAVVCNGTTATAYYDGTNVLHSITGSSSPNSNEIGIGAYPDGGHPLYSGSEICAVRMTKRALSAAEIQLNRYVDSQRFGLSSVPEGYTNVNSVISVRLTEGVAGFEFSTDGGTTWSDEAWAQLGSEVTLVARRTASPSAELEFSGLPDGARVEGNAVTLTPTLSCNISVSDPNASALTSFYAQSGSADLIAHLDAIENAGAGVHASSTNGWTDLAGGLTMTASAAAAFSGDAWTPDGKTHFTTSSDAAKNALAGNAFTLEMVISHPGRATEEYEYWMTIGTGTSRSLIVELRKDSGQTENPLIHAVEYKEKAWNNRSSITSDSGITKWGRRQYIAVVCDGQGATTYCDGTNTVHRTVGNEIAPASSAITLGGAWEQTWPLATGAEVCAVRMTKRALTADELLRNNFVDSVRFMGGSATSETSGYRIVNGVLQVRVSCEGEGYKFSTDGGTSWTDDALEVWCDADADTAITVQKEGAATIVPRFSTMPRGATQSGQTVSFNASCPGKLTVDIPAAADLYAQSGSADLIAHLDAIENAGAGVHASSTNGWTDLAGGLTMTASAAAAFSGDAWTPDGKTHFTTSSDAAKNALAGNAFTLEMVISHPGRATEQYEYWMTIGTGASRSLIVELRKDSGQTENPLIHAVEYKESGWNNRSSITSDSGITKWGRRQYIAVVCDGQGATTYCDGTNTVHRTVGNEIAPASSAITLGGSWEQSWPLATGAEVCAVRMTKRALTAAEIQQNYFVDGERFAFTSVPDGYRMANGKVQIRVTSGDRDVELSADGGETWASEVWIDLGDEVTLSARFAASAETAAYFTDVGLVDAISNGSKTLTFTPEVPVTLGVSSARTFVWTGKAGDGKFSTLGNWKPSAEEAFVGGESFVIDLDAETSIMLDADITARTLMFAGEGVVTLANPDDATTNVLTVAKVANSGSAAPVLRCRTAFAGTYNVDFTSAAVDFAGGATASCPDNGIFNTEFNRTLTGAVTFTNSWTFPGQGSSKPLVVPNGSVFVGAGFVGDQTASRYILDVREGGTVRLDSLSFGWGRGFVAVAGLVELANTCIMYSGTTAVSVGSLDSCDTGTLRAGGLEQMVHETGTDATIHVATCEVGALGVKANGGQGFKADYDFTLRATADMGFSVAGGSTYALTVDSGKTVTLDTAGYTVSNANLVAGAGTLAVTGTGTAVFAAGGGPSNVTVAAGATIAIGKGALLGTIGAGGRGAVIKPVGGYETDVPCVIGKLAADIDKSWFTLDTSAISGSGGDRANLLVDTDGNLCIRVGRPLVLLIR